MLETPRTRRLLAPATCTFSIYSRMSPNRLHQDKQIGDCPIYEFQLNDNVYRLNTNAQLKVVSRKMESRPKVCFPQRLVVFTGVHRQVHHQVNQAVFKELPDKRKASPLPKEYIQYNGNPRLLI